MRATYYTSGRAVEDAMAVVAGWIGQNRRIDVRFHNGTAVDADIFKGKIRIPKLACASGITQDTLMTLRRRVYHEAGHIDLSSIARDDYPKPGALFDIWNAIEDTWMEAEESKKHKGCEVVFRHGVTVNNRKIGERIRANGAAGPLWEAMTAMMFIYVGQMPSWELNPKAAVYVDAAYSTFAEVGLSQSSYDNLELAKRILKILKAASKEYKKQHPEEKQQPQSQPQPQQSQDEESRPESEDAQAGRTDDVDDEPSPEQEPQPCDEPKEGEESEDGEPKEGEDDSDDEVKGDSESDEDDESADGVGSKGDEETGEDEDGGSAGSSDEEDAGDGDESAPGDPDSSGDESEDDPDEGGDKPVSSDSDETSEGEDDEDGDESDTSKPGGDEDGDFSSTPEDDDDDGEDLEDELEGLDREKALDEEIAEALSEISPEDSRYLSRRDLDRHIVPEIHDGDKETFKSRRSGVSVMVTAMTRTLEQALRAMSRNRQGRCLRQGRIDKRRLVQIARGLSREVFYKVSEGTDLNTAVEILIDESGSMRRGCIPVQLLAMSIGEALTAIGVPFEITGTMTSGDRLPLDGMTRTQPIIYRHYKMFEESWQSVCHRIVHTGFRCNNIDGEAVEYAAFRLSARPESRKVVFSLSDGCPCGGQDMDDELAGNLIRVCERCRQNGIEVYGFGIMTDDPEKYYGKDYFLYLESVTAIGPEFTRTFAGIISKGAVRV